MRSAPNTFCGFGNSPVGNTFVGVENGQIVFLGFGAKSSFSSLTYWNYDKNNEAAEELIADIFSSSDHSFPTNQTGTAFQKMVWKALEEIPYGETCTYEDIAKTIGNPQGTRAVASAIGRNNISVLIPCHRVIGKNGALRGYRWGISIKEQLLEWEQQQATMQNDKRKVS